MQKFMSKGGCIMQSTRLTESLSKAVEILLDIDPIHVQRESMAARMEAHLQHYHTSGRRIPVNVVNMPIDGTGMSTRACVVVAGSRDEKTVAKILKDHPFPHLDTLPYSYRRTRKDMLTTRLKQHDMVISQTKAFKIEGMNPSDIPKLREEMFKCQASQCIVDVSEANHSHTTGVAYIQYLITHKDEVLQQLLGILPQYLGAALRDPDASTTMTANTRDTREPPPKSRFASMVDVKEWPKLNTKQPPKSVSWNDSANKPKPCSAPRSFSAVLMKDLQDEDVSNDSSAGQDSWNSSLGTGKSTRETELEITLQATMEDLVATQCQLTELRHKHEEIVGEMTRDRENMEKMHSQAIE